MSSENKVFAVAVALLVVAFFLELVRVVHGG